MYDFQSERWNEFELPKLSLRELLALAKLLGCASHGSKETVVVRLLAQRELRLKLARFTDNPEELAISYKRESLRDSCSISRRENLLERSFKSIRSRSAAQSVAGCHLFKPETRVSGKSRLPPQLFTDCEFF